MAVELLDVGVEIPPPSVEDIDDGVELAGIGVELPDNPTPPVIDHPTYFIYGF